MFIKSYDFDPNITILELIEFVQQHNVILINLDLQLDLPVPSITLSIPDLDTLNKIDEILG